MNSFSFLSFFIIFLSWIVISCATSSFRQYTSRKYYVRIDNEEEDGDGGEEGENDGAGEEDLDDNNGKGEYDITELGGTSSSSSYPQKKRRHRFKRKYLEYFQLFSGHGHGHKKYQKLSGGGGGGGSKYKRYNVSDDSEVPLSPYRDVVNYISVGLSLVILGLTLACQNWWHINKLVPFVPLIMAVANIYASAAIDETTTEINSLKGIKSPYKGA